MLTKTAKRIVKGLVHAVGLEVYRRPRDTHQPENGAAPAGEVNQVMPDVSRDEGLQDLVASRVGHPSSDWAARPTWSVTVSSAARR